MDEQKRNNIEEAASALIKNAEADSVSLSEKREQKNGNGGNAGKAPEKAPGKEGKFFKKYKIKDILLHILMVHLELLQDMFYQLIQI